MHSLGTVCKYPETRGRIYEHKFKIWARMLAKVVVDLLLYLSWRNVTIVSDTSGAIQGLLADMAVLTSRAGVRARFSFSGPYPADGPVVYLQSQCGPKLNQHEVLNLSVSRQSSDSLLLITECLESIHEELKTIDRPHSLFVTSESLLDKRIFMRVMTVRGKQEVKICSILLSQETPPYCLHSAMGSELKAVALQYLPFVRVQELEGATEMSGFTVDLWTNVGRIGNFTHPVRKEPSGIWGSFPAKSNNVNESVGIVGRLMRHEIDNPMSVWSHTVARVGLADFTFSTKNAEYHCYTDKKALNSQDLYFQTYPFTRTSWLVTLQASFVCIIFSTMLMRLEFESTAKSVSLLAGLVFTIVVGFYSGALTMFLAKNPDPPFSNIRWVVESDQWELKLAKGEEYVFRNYFKISEPWVAAADRKYTSQEYLDSQALTYENTIEILLKVPYSVMFTSDDRIATTLVNLRERVEGLDLHQFCKPLRVQVCWKQNWKEEHYVFL